MNKMQTRQSSGNPSDPIALALAEDIGTGDVTCEFFVPAELTGRARIIAKEPAVLAGAETAAEVFARIDPGLTVSVVRVSGSSVVSGDPVLEISGPVRSILTGERVALNFLQRLSGIATLTRRYVDAVRGTKAKIFDTRKTTPGLRALEKAAVKAGCGENHRFGLFDMVLVKDNHLAARSDREFLRAAIARVRAARPGTRIELEADTLDQVRMFLEIGGIDVILLDNMPDTDMREAVRLGAGRVQFEASGGVTLDTVAKIAATGVDFISAGALTHSARAIDFSLELTATNG
jgi:nicotinate-nucleotide pyrophosphorylase (carboxylating)